MAKKLSFSLLLSLLQLALTPAFATNSLPWLESPEHQFDFCDAPAPDNFYVASIGYGLVNLSWLPVWTGATHTLNLFQEDGFGGWNNISTLYNIPGNSYAIPGLTAGSYKASIATNCTSGETSSKNSLVWFKIIDLLTGGRIPVTPIPIVNCGQIDYLNHDWVGFRVKETVTHRSNGFEFQVEGASALIKRVADNQIVAVNGAGAFPVGAQQLGVGFSFEMHDKGKPIAQQSIGFVKVSQNGLGTIGLCIDGDKPWKTEYDFVALAAESVVIGVPGGGTGQGLSHSHSDDKFTAQSPFTNNLTVFASGGLLDDNEVNISLMDMNGSVVLSQKFNTQNLKEPIPTESFSPGLYILQIKSNQGTEVLKVIKL